MVKSNRQYKILAIIIICSMFLFVLTILFTVVFKYLKLDNVSNCKMRLILIIMQSAVLIFSKLTTKKYK